MWPYMRKLALIIVFPRLVFFLLKIETVDIRAPEQQDIVRNFFADQHLARDLVD